MMLSSECTPLCPFRAFKCTKNALVIRRRRDRLESLCDWSGDRCIGWRCQFADCMRHALYPDGTCSLMVTKKERKPSIDEEAARVKSDYTNLGKRFKKLGVDIEGEV
ncbi:MAG: hypothetical protein QW096_06025 [Thermofilaceae archaeon]